MRISTSLLPALFSPSTEAQVAVVIDVLRATSVITQALDSGATSVTTCREIEDARSLASSISGASSSGTLARLQCGERSCRPIPGFDLGNSPAEYTPDTVAKRELVLTTTNGTAAIEAAASVEQMFIASFLNFSAVIEALSKYDRVHLVCAGTDGHVSAEDVLLAGGLAVGLQKKRRVVQICDESRLACELWLGWFPGTSLPSPADLAARLSQSRGGRNLKAAGFEADLLRCAAIDSVASVANRVSRSPAKFVAQA